MGLEVCGRSKIEQRLKQAAVRHMYLRRTHLLLGDVGVPTAGSGFQVGGPEGIRPLRLTNRNRCDVLPG
jgi:hypothetical protein